MGGAKKAVLIGFLIVLFGGVFTFFFVPAVSLRIFGGPYQEAIASAAACGPVKALLGDGIDLSTFGTVGGSSGGGSGVLKIPVGGSRASGTLSYQWDTDRPLTWSLVVGGTTVYDEECKKKP